MLGFYSLGYWLPLSSYTLEESVIFRLLVTSNLFIYLLREWGGGEWRAERKEERILRCHPLYGEPNAGFYLTTLRWKSGGKHLKN